MTYQPRNVQNAIPNPPRNGALSRNPATNNNLLPNRFRFSLKRAPNTEFWIQRVAIPGFSIAPTAQPNPFVEIPLSGEHIDFETLGITMLVDAQLSNYLEIYTWLKSLGFPDKFKQYASLLENPPILEDGVKSEILVTILNGQQQPRFQFVFHDAFPVALSGLDFDSTDPSLNRLQAHVEFKYTDFDLIRLNA